MRPTAKIKYGKWETKYKGVIFSIKQRQVMFPDGSKKTFEYSFRSDSVVILPFDEQGRLLLIYEFRMHPDKYVHFLPAGKMDKSDKNPRTAAIRELREETGFTAKRLKLIRKRFSSGYSVWESYIFAAKNLKPAPLVGDEFLPIEVRPVSMEKAVEMALNGEIENEFMCYNILIFDYLVKSGQWKW